ncbi:CapA family protein [Actinophytocola sp.]|uniref:CapA family protein n=1 Tax=Actinophytocola sp. TaxID=1872138 RepID=UPI003D6AF2AD
MKVCLTGDCLTTRPMTGGQPGFGTVHELLADADVRFTNLEMSFPGLPMTPAPLKPRRGLRLAARSSALEGVLDVGFNLLNTANNHMCDYGTQGLLDTLALLDHHGVAHAGGGRSLAEARTPRYLSTGVGRAALIGVTASLGDITVASDGAGPIAARPGVNALRYRTELWLEPELFDAVRRVDRALATDRSTRHDAGLGSWSATARERDSMRFLDYDVVCGEPTGVRTYPLDVDVEAICLAIRTARLASDIVIVSIHCHESSARGWNQEPPADFLLTAARRFVDEGADVIVGHGPHLVRGIEVYRERPILLSLGNFCFTDETVEFMAPEQFVELGIPEPHTPQSLVDFRSHNPDGTRRGLWGDDRYWEGLMATCDFAAGVCTVRLHVLDLRRGEERVAVRGLPMVADPAKARSVLRRVLAHSPAEVAERVELSVEDGTTVGLLRLKAGGGH